MAPSPAYSTRFKVGAVAVIAAAGLLFALAIRAFDEGGRDPVLRGGDAAVVESLLPRRNAQVPQQSSVGVDLAIGWEGTLVIGGVEIPADELEVTPELGLVEYTPGAGKTVERLSAGQNCVSAVVWRVAEGRGVDDRTIPWCFDVV